VTDSRRGHRYLEHTADIGVEAWGADLREAFEEAATAVAGLMVDPVTVEERAEWRVRIDGDDLEDLLVGWLTRLIALVDSDDRACRRFHVDALGERHLEARAWGEPIDPARHRLLTAVKAARSPA
jgi:SHS2 domain-containing protein